MANVIYTFTTGGAIGSTPPTQEQLDTSYLGTSLQSSVTCIAGIQKWIVPFNGLYTINAIGAAGGKGSGPLGTMLGGFGADISGQFELKANQELYILVGQKGTDSSYTGYVDACTAGGGGMSVVVVRDSSSSDTLSVGGESIPVRLLICAGAGNGGGDYAMQGKDGQNAVLHEGSTESYSTTDYCGGGYKQYKDTAYNGKSFLAGGSAATYVYTRQSSSAAGFGGGGANTDDGDGGGGGGYRGGVRGGSGGSSYNAGVNKTAALNTLREDGRVVITAIRNFKKLVRNNVDNMLYTYTDGTWTSLGSELTADAFNANGMDTIAVDTLSYFTDFTILSYTPNIDEETIDTVISMTPHIQLCKMIVPVDLYDKRLLKINITGNEDTRVALSADGNTFKAIHDGVWVDVSLDNLSDAWLQCNTLKEVDALYKNAYMHFITDALYVAFIVDANTQELTTKVSEFSIIFADKGVARYVLIQ